MLKLYIFYKGVNVNSNTASIIILAGGFGTRMKSKIPKVLHKICGKEMLFCIIDEVSKISDDIHIILFNEASLITKELERYYPNHRLHLHLQNYSQYPGTAGAIMQGNGESPKSPIPTKYEKILILSGDMPLVESAKLREFIANDCDITLGILELDNASGYGRVVLEQNRVTQIIEEKDASEKEKQIKFANAGIYCIAREILEKFLPHATSNNNQGEFYLTDIIQYAFKKHIPIHAIHAKIEQFMGVNSKIDLANAESFMMERLRMRAMKQGVIFHLPETIYIESEVEFEGECEIESGVVLKGKSKIISSHIKAHSVVEDSIISHSSIGPFARIRPKTQIIDSAIGNFVEVKASKLVGVKAGHLSYLGDSEIGNGTNIGAGVITCNYDGKKKHKTIIGENVFVGSDSQLIAPIKIESNVIIASGSTLTRDAKDGDLVISRTKQENKSGFFYKFFDKEPQK